MTQGDIKTILCPITSGHILRSPWAYNLNHQGHSQPHSPEWARLPLSSFFPQISLNFLFFLKLSSFSSSFWSSRWASCPPRKALAKPLWTMPHIAVNLCILMHQWIVLQMRCKCKLHVAANLFVKCMVKHKDKNSQCLSLLRYYGPFHNSSALQA